MLKPILSSVVLLVSASLLQADKPVSVGSLPTPVQSAINKAKGNGQVRVVNVLNIEGKTLYQVDFKERGEEKQLLISDSGKVVEQRTLKSPKGRGKAKITKGKGGGDDADDSSAEPVNQTAGSANSTTVPAPAPTPVPPPPVQTAPVPAPAPPPAQPPVVVQAPVPTPQPVPAPQPPATPARTKTDIKTELTRRINIINTLDDRPNAQRAGLAAISRETGVPVKTLETQRGNHPVGTAGLLIANELAKATGKPAGNFLKQRLNKKEWEVIAAENKVDIAGMFPKLDRVEQAMAGAIGRTVSSPRTAATKR